MLTALVLYLLCSVCNAEFLYIYIYICVMWCMSLGKMFSFIKKAFSKIFAFVFLVEIAVLILIA